MLKCKMAISSIPYTNSLKNHLDNAKSCDKIKPVRRFSRFSNMAIFLCRSAAFAKPYNGIPVSEKGHILYPPQPEQAACAGSDCRLCRNQHIVPEKTVQNVLPDFLQSIYNLAAAEKSEKSPDQHHFFGRRDRHLLRISVAPQPGKNFQTARKTFPGHIPQNLLFRQILRQFYGAPYHSA